MADLQSQANKEKSKSGFINKEKLRLLLQDLKKDNIINEFYEKLNVQKSGFEYKNHFLADFLVVTIDKKYIIIKTTSSYRQDRIKQHFFDIEGIYRYSKYSGKIVASIFLVPESENENTSFLTYRKEVREKKRYSPFSHSLTFNEFISFIEDYKNSENEEYKKTQGSLFAKRGQGFEKSIVKSFNDKNFINNYKNSNLDKLEFKVLDFLLSKNNIFKKDIIGIYASDTIPLLNSGGKSKTDFFITIKTFSERIIETFSAKFTNQEYVSCHEYDYKRFSKILNCEGTKLEEYLSLFQKYGGYKELLKNFSDQYDLNEFIELLKNKKNLLNEWVLKGKNDNKNILDVEKQIVENIIITTDKGSTLIKPIDEYINLLNDKIPFKKSNFGTVFNWTYPSKRKGKKIQLKLPILI